jgi:hypothetical protein
MNKGTDRRETAQSHSNKLFLASKAAPSSRRDMTATDTETDRCEINQSPTVPSASGKGEGLGHLPRLTGCSYLPTA